MLWMSQAMSVKTGRYTLISTMSFMIALIPPQETGVLEYGDVAGNLDEGWELPVIRRMTVVR